MADRFSDQKPDLADLCLVRMSELFPRHSVIAIDRKDFQVYRRNKREAIPPLRPPERDKHDRDGYRDLVGVGPLALPRRKL